MRQKTRKNTKQKRKTQYKRKHKQHGGSLCHPIDTDSYKKGDIFAHVSWYIYKEAKHGDTYMIKEFGMEDYVSPDSILAEINASKWASAAGISPEVVHTEICDSPKSGYIVMEKIIGTNFAQTPPTEEELREMRRLLDILYDAGYNYRDRSKNNFMRGRTRKYPDDRVFIIDYDFCEKESDVPIPHELREYDLK